MAAVARIGIDCRLAGSRHAGIGRYIQNLVREVLAAQVPRVTWVLFFSDHSQQAEVLPHLPPQVEIVIAPIRHYSLEEQVRLPQIFSQARLDLLHVPHFNVPLLYRGKLMVTIHDLLWHEQRGTQVTTLSPWKYWLKYLFYHLVVSQAVAKAAAIIVPATTIAQTVTKYYPAAAAKTTVTYEGVAAQFHRPRSSALSKPSAKTEYHVVYTGSLYPHKNLQVVLQMLQQYPEVRLTIVGSRSVFLDQVKAQVAAMAIQYQVTFTGYLSDADLCELYQTADALVQPSLSEGFGLTGLEALAQGLPAIVSDIPIFKEIYQDVAMFFNPTDPVSVYQALVQAVQQRQQIHAKTPALLRRYSWKTMATQVIEVYQSLISHA